MTWFAALSLCSRWAAVSVSCSLGF